MNSEESICKPYQKDVVCFQKVPDRFEFDGSSNNSCSLVFPPGYSIYVEEFSLDQGSAFGLSLGIGIKSSGPSC